MHTQARTQTFIFDEKMSVLFFLCSIHMKRNRKKRSMTRLAYSEFSSLHYICCRIRVVYSISFDFIPTNQTFSLQSTNKKAVFNKYP